MPPPNASMPLTEFAEQELRQSPRWITKVLDDVVQQLSQGLPGESSAERAQLADLLMALRPLRLRMVGAYEAALRRLVTGDGGTGPATGGDAGQGSGGLSSPALQLAPLSGGRGAADGLAAGLSLVDEQAVSSDVQIAFCVARIKDVAEFELREITAFSSALVGDLQVSADHNPLKPDLCARALWAAAQCLPDRGGLRGAFMKQAALPLAQEMRKVYAAACGRLEDAGLQPAVYKTVVVPTGARIPRPGDTLSGDAFRSVEGHTVPDRLDPVPGTFRTSNDAEYLALLGQVFDHILSDRTLPGDVKFAVSRLQPSAQRLASHDPTLLDSHEHPLWLLLDAIAWQPEILPDPPHPQRSAAMQVVQTLVTHIGTSTRQEAPLYRWAIDRLRQAERERFDQVVQRMAEAVQALKGTDFHATEAGRWSSTQASSQASTQASALDTGQLGTVPSQLLDLPGSQPSAQVTSRWLASVMPADVARIYLDGAWVNVQLVWVHPERECFLWADCRCESAWSLRAKALTVLQAEGLALPLQPRSLVKAAARLIVGRKSR